MKKSKGFTLVELLVVIAIIALLMGILMPALSRVRRSAQGSACMVQMKQWATVYSAYTVDFDGYFIPDYYKNPSGDTSWPPPCQWWIVLEDYYKDLDLLLCPSAKKVKDINDQTGKVGTMHEGAQSPFCSAYMGSNKNSKPYNISYTYNGWLGDEGGAKNAVTWRSGEKRWQTVNRIKQPNYVPVIGDTIWHARKFPQATTDPALTGPDKNVGDDNPNRLIEYRIRRHGPINNPNINMAFSDFSVRPVGLKALWSLYWHRNWVQERKGSSNSDMTNKWPEWMKGYSEDGVINYP